MNKKTILVLSVLALIVFSFIFFNYINDLPNTIFESANSSMRALYSKGSFDDVLNMKFYTASAIFLVVSAIPLTLAFLTLKQIIQKEPI